MKNNALEKIQEALEQNAWKISRVKPRYDQGRYDMAYECLDIVDNIIKEEQKEKTNFDVITESVESLAQEITLTECREYRECKDVCDKCIFFHRSLEKNIEYLKQKV